MNRRLLLDTHVVYWWLRGDRKLGARTRALIERHECVASVVTLFELLLKSGVGKLSLPDGALAPQIEACGFRVLNLTAEHVEAGAALALLHADPYDRLLLGVARSERMPLLTRDAALLEAAAPLLGDLILEA
jgi:PIN domain nuclease of toxin-antitoxin system